MMAGLDEARADRGRGKPEAGVAHDEGGASRGEEGEVAASREKEGREASLGGGGAEDLGAGQDNTGHGAGQERGGLGPDQDTEGLGPDQEGEDLGPDQGEGGHGPDQD